MTFLYLILILTVLASGCLIFIIGIDHQKILKILLAFSGAFLIGISFMKLIPEVFAVTAKFAGLFVMVGFLIQLVLELITEGVEHGHKHKHSEGETVSPFILLTGLCIHAFLEGMPIVKSIDGDIRHSLVIGIIIHNVPISITLMSLLLHYECSKPKALVYLGIFALMTPLGSMISSMIPVVVSAVPQTFFIYVMAIVIGIFLHVSTSILFETEENHRYNLQKFITVCCGILVAFGLSIL
jgi:zinc and cadmium transporter